MLSPQGANTHLLYKNKKIIAQRAQSTHENSSRINRVVVGALQTSFVALFPLYPEGGRQAGLQLIGAIRDPFRLLAS